MLPKITLKLACIVIRLKVEFLVGGWLGGWVGGRWYKLILMSNPTFVELCEVVLGLSWGCVVVELWF